MAASTSRKTRAPARKAAGGKRPSKAAAPRAQPVQAASGPAVQARQQPAAPGSGAKKAAAGKPKKLKLVRDSFTIPKTEFAVLDLLKQRAAKLGRPTKKSEMLRAGVKALEAMTDAEFLACVARVPAIKTGRPAKS